MLHTLFLTLALGVVGDELPPAKDAIKPVILHDYEWRRGDDPDQIHLFSGGHQVGTWRYAEHAYHPYHADHDSWGYPAPLPRDRDGHIITVPAPLGTPRYHGRARGC